MKPVDRSHPRANNKVFCSTQCQKQAYRPKQKQAWTKQNAKQAEKRSTYSPNKVKCLECNRYYHAPLRHVRYKHKITAEQYKELHGLFRGKGILSPSTRAKHQDATKDNPHVITENLIEKGKQTRYRPNQSNLGKYTRRPEHLELLRNLPQNYKKKTLTTSTRGQAIQSKETRVKTQDNGVR